MNTILDFVDQNGVLHEESVAYAKPGEFPFSFEEFKIFAYDVWAKSSKRYRIKNSDFKTHCAPFESKGKKYFVQIMYGQGESVSIFTKSEFDSLSLDLVKMNSWTLILGGLVAFQFLILVFVVALMIKNFPKNEGKVTNPTPGGIIVDEEQKE